jgi:hypothetical protein
LNSTHSPKHFPELIKTIRRTGQLNPQNSAKQFQEIHFQKLNKTAELNPFFHS